MWSISIGDEDEDAPELTMSDVLNTRTLGELDQLEVRNASIDALLCYICIIYKCILYNMI